MTEFCGSNLLQIKELLKNLDKNDFTHPSKISDGATIGQHVRHILEFYICLLNGLNEGKVNYDNRERNQKIQSDPEFAARMIDKICGRLSESLPDQKITVVCNHSNDESQNFHLESSLYRELAYNLEHSIHHQALIKNILSELDMDHLTESNFGVAPGTIRYHS